MPEREVDFLLVGGGVAAASCATELRRRGAEGSILLVGREPDPPYDRPPLSKSYLAGGSDREQAYVKPEAWYEENGVELRTKTSVMSLDPGERRAKLQGGDEVVFGQALLATGAMVNLLRLDGAELEGIHYLRAFGNSDAIREDAASAEHVVMVGGSYIGCEVAATLTAQGRRCTIVMLEEVTLSGSFGEEAGRYFHELLESKGVEIVGGAEVTGFGGEGRVSSVALSGGREVECDMVVVGAGVRPDTMLAGRAKLELGDGIVCDSRLRTSAEGIYAAGDCCSYESELHGRRLRVEHIDVAGAQGRHVAGCMLGDDEPFREVPYFYSDLADWAGLEYVGPAASWDRVIWRGERDSGEFSAWYVEDGRLVAALAVGRGEDLMAARRMIAAGGVLDDPEALADTGRDLDELG